MASTGTWDFLLTRATASKKSRSLAMAKYTRGAVRIDWAEEAEGWNRDSQGDQARARISHGRMHDRRSRNRACRQPFGAQRPHADEIHPEVQHNHSGYAHH